MSYSEDFQKQSRVIRPKHKHRIQIHDLADEREDLATGRHTKDSRSKNLNLRDAEHLLKEFEKDYE